MITKKNRPPESRRAVNTIETGSVLSYFEDIREIPQAATTRVAYIDKV
jgi:hypothetical protein